MAAPYIVPPPVFEDGFTDEQGRLTSDAFNWFVINVLPRLNQSALSFLGNNNTPPFEQTNQNASIAATALALGSLSTGYYRVTSWLRITTPDGVSSSVTPFIDFTSKGVACVMNGAALTANAIGSPLSHTFMALVQSPGPIRVGTTYVSNTPGQAVYEVSFLVERVQ